jgi:tryptophan synthase beta chain
MRNGRPTPLCRARRLEARLKTPARIYYKREDVSVTGSHKSNTAIAQAYYASRAGIAGVCTETGAGQWGTALAMGCSMFGLGCTVFMVRASYDQKPYRRTLMRVYGAMVHPSPSRETAAGRAALEARPDHPGSLGLAISEAVEMAASRKELCYSLGSVLNHVLMHQTVIGRELIAQLKLAEERPDILIGCVGGGSNFGGLVLPYVGQVLRGEAKGTRFLAVEPESVPSLTKGPYRYDHGDAAGLTPFLMMHTLGHGFVPPPIHAGGLRYHGAAPLVSALKEQGIVSALALPQRETFKAGELFARTEGVLPAPESAHAVAAAVREAEAARDANEERVVVFNLSGHGLLDLGGYESYLDGAMG